MEATIDIGSNGADFANPLANRGFQQQKSKAELKELEEIEAAERAAAAGNLTPLFLLQDKQFVIRAALFLGGGFLVYFGIFLGFADAIMFFHFPGLMLWLAWFVMECKNNKTVVTLWSMAEDRWAKGKSGGTFFFFIAMVVGIFATAQILNHCEESGATKPSMPKAPKITSSMEEHNRKYPWITSSMSDKMASHNNLTSSVRDGAANMAGAVVRNDEQDTKVQGCSFGLALGSVSFVMFCGSFLLLVQDQYERLVRITEVAEVGRAVDKSKDQEWAVEGSGGKIQEV